MPVGRKEEGGGDRVKGATYIGKEEGEDGGEAEGEVGGKEWEGKRKEWEGRSGRERGRRSGRGKSTG